MEAYDRQLAQVVHRYAEVKREGDITKGLCAKWQTESINTGIWLSQASDLLPDLFGIKGAVSKFVEFEDILSDTQKRQD